MKYPGIFSRFLLSTLAVASFSVAALAQEITKPTNRADAIQKAKEEGKLMVVQMGRPDCSDCRGVSNHFSKIVPPIKQTAMAGFVYWYIDIDRSSEEDPYVRDLGQFALPVIALVDPFDASRMLQRANGNLTPNTLLLSLKSQMAKLPLHISNQPDKPLTNAFYKVAGVARKSSLPSGTGTNNLASVQWRLNSGPWSAASTSDGWANWTADIVLQPGTNFFYCYVNAGATNSWTNRTTFVYQGAAANVGPTISADPQPLSAPLGGDAQFTVLASGTPPLFYQWQKETSDLSNDTRINGSQTSSLSIADVGNGDSGGYRVIVTNAYGSVTSLVANLTVFVDSTQPDFEVTSHANNQNVTGTSASLSGTFSDPAPSGGISSITANGIPANINGSNWSVVVTNLVVGENQIEIVAIDKAGNSRQAFFFLNRLPKDESGPVLNIISHQFGQTVTGNITLTGTAQDGGGGVAWVKVNGVNVPGATVEGANVANWSAVLRLRPGTNLIAITTADKLGNPGSIQTMVILDSTVPTIAVKTPARNAQVGQEFVALSGTARDNIVGVYYQLNNGGWTKASGTAIWNDGGYAVPGANVLRAYAVDTAGRTSAVAVVNFTYNRLVGYKGAYNGLFKPDSASVTASNSGFFSLQLSDKGTFSGKLTMGTSALPFSGSFNQQTMESQVTVKRRAPLSSLVLTLKLNSESENPENGVFDTNVVTGTVAEAGSWNSAVRAYRAVTRAKVAGAYTMLIEGCGYWGTCFGINTNQPNGDSPASVKVTTGGIVQMNGTLADGVSAIRQNVAVSEAGYWPVYVSLYRGGGVLLGWVNNLWTTNVINEAREGMLHWVQAAGVSGSHYTDGFSQPRITRLTAYTKPATGKNPVKWTHADVVVTGGNIPFEQPLTNHVVLTNGIFQVSAGALPGLSLKVVPSTGLFTGSFTNPVNNKSTKVSGALTDLEDPMAPVSSGGWWLGPSKESGNLRIYPAE